jgi:hypothetical protein
MNISEFESGIEFHRELNPVLWNNDDLHLDVRPALIKIAEDFKQFINVPFQVSDLIITGGQVSYYYTKHSDLDLHLIVDFGTVDCERAVEELFDSKRLLYNQKYNITVKGIPVELYVEDIRFPAVSASYSILKQQWIKYPEFQDAVIDHENIEKMSRVWQRVMAAAIGSKDVKTIRKTVNLLRKYRQMGLKSAGEYSTPNLVFKTLRNSDLIRILMDRLDRAHEQELSLGQTRA